MTSDGTAAETGGTDTLIKQWRASASSSEQVAASLAAKINGGQLRTWDDLPSLATLADEHDVSQRTVTRAKTLLAGHGFLTLQGGRYYVARAEPS